MTHDLATDIEISVILLIVLALFDNRLSRQHLRLTHTGLHQP